MMRVCNLDTCPVGIATQNPELRKRFKGKPEYVVNYMKFVAQEMREYMAKLGVRTVDELVGRTDLLKELPEAKEYHLNLSAILNNPYVDKKHPICYNKKNEYNFELEKTLDEKVLLTKLKTALDKSRREAFLSMLEIQTVPLVQSLVLKLQRNITTHWKMIHLLYSVQELADRALEHLFQMVLH